MTPNQTLDRMTRSAVTFLCRGPSRAPRHSVSLSLGPSNEVAMAWYACAKTGCLRSSSDSAITLIAESEMSKYVSNRDQANSY